MILPGSTIGILGGGQLGRMMVLAGHDMGYRFHIFEPNCGNCAGAVSEQQINAPYDDESALEAFAAEVDLVTIEFENIPVETLQKLEWKVPVYPDSKTLMICQNRKHEKLFLKENGFPCADFELVESVEELKQAVEKLGMPCVLKTADPGYDGRGQFRLNKAEDISLAWEKLAVPVAVLEKWIAFRGEYSIIGARNKSGNIKLFPMAENIHTRHILDISIAPARIESGKYKEAEDLVMAVIEKLGTVGLLAVELFYTQAGTWIINELAPRPHDSGHYTLDACVTSQFEQHIRAVCDLPLASTAITSPVVVVNLLGDLWPGKEPNWDIIYKHPMAKLHLYDKGKTKMGRKMGHFSVLDDDINSALADAMQIKSALQTDSS